MIRPVAALSALMLLGACASGEPGSFGISKSTGGGLLGGAGGAFLGSRIAGGDKGLIGKGRDTQLIGAAVGALAGAWLGSEAGSSMDRADRGHAERASRKATSAPVGEPIVWSNPDTGNRGQVVATREGRNADTGAYCREFQHEISVGGRSERAFGTACRQPDGSWKIVE